MIMSRFTFPNDFPLDSSELLMLAYANYKSNKVKSNSLEPTFETLEFNLDLANSKSFKI